MNNRLRDAIYGLAIGDALGVPYEFESRGSFVCDDMVGYGTHHQPEGTWSDDTSMTLATCASIKECEKIDIEDMRNKFNLWLNQAAYTAGDEVFDIGGTTEEALCAGKGIDEGWANGNGSLMRILPLAFVECANDEIADVSAITHAHRISIRGCQIYIAIAKQLLKGIPLSDCIKEEDTPYHRLTQLNELKEEEIRSSGYVVDTLEASLWCLLKTDNYKDAVIKAVNLGSDTDTVAAVTGGLAGIIYGYEAIPEEWIEKLRNKELIEDCLF